MTQLFKMAFRDLGRNKRRSLLSALAVSIGMSLLLLMASVVDGEMRGALENTIRLQSGHLQIRPVDYNENKTSLKWEDLIADPQGVIAKLKNIPQVTEATPRLFASGIVSRGENSAGVQVIGIDPASPANQVFREGLLEGSFITPDDREGILIGRPLARKFNLKAGDQVSLLVNKSEGDVDEQMFIVRGIYTTNTVGYDESSVFMPLVKAQAFTGAGDHATIIFVMLQDREQAESVASALQSSSMKAVTWEEMNDLIVQFESFADAYMTVLYLIVLGITATVVTNTLVMAVFERTREIGILAAIGMKGRRIMAQFLVEGAMIATLGILGGLILGGVLVWYFTVYGFFIGDMGMTGILMGDQIYAHLTVQDTIYLAVVAYVVTLLASLYPATLAARMEPVEALHGK
jgi:ABC-type lipoprotein release transport system permease subunit